MRKVLVIAEAGVNHNGSIKMAKNLIKIASESGADFIKFQSFKANKLVSKKAIKAEYQKNNLKNDIDNSQFNMLKKLELSNEDHITLIEECKRNGINFLSTAFDEEGLDYLVSLGIELIKIPSGEITNYPFLKRVGELGLKTILSTGMADLKEVELAIDVLTHNGIKIKDLTVVHCNTEYPTPMEDVNLRAMNTIGDKFGVKIGYSDHTLGIEVPIAAVALGASVIEKHFTLDRTLPGPDHAASLEPKELKSMIKAIRNVELIMLGDGIKKPSKSEKKNITIARKSIHTNRNLSKGHILTNEDLIALRPGDGISPMRRNSLIGKKINKDILEGEKLSEKDFE
jgi:N,N'-diacetyllegionaminate synthase